MSKLIKFFSIWKKDGYQGLIDKFKSKMIDLHQEKIYQKWIYRFDTLSNNHRESIKNKIETFAYQPLISIIMPVFDIDEKWLRLSIKSVLAQFYQNWELCISDDCSTKPHVQKVLKEYCTKDSRIKITFRAENGHISAALNSGLELASGEFVAFLDHDDELSEHALFFIVDEINRFPKTKLIYSDEDMIDENGVRFSPKFKPDFSPDLFYSFNYINHLSVFQTALLKKLEGFRLGFEGSQDYDLLLRFIEKIPENEIRHIPRILYHWRAIKGSVAYSPNQKNYAFPRARQALQEHLDRKNIKGNVIQGFDFRNHVIFDLPEKSFISLISSEKNYPVNFENFECMTVEKFSAKSFNYAAKHSRADILVFLEKGVTPLSKNWIDELSAIALQKEIGAVGGKIFFSNRTIRHNGIILGINHSFDFAFRKLPKDFCDPLTRTKVASNFLAITGVLVVRRKLFEELNGFDEIHFNEGLYDIDLCLRLRKKGHRIVLFPACEFIQTEESPTEKILKNEDSFELNFFKDKWKNFIEKDEFYNPNFSLKKNFLLNVF